VDQIRIEVMQVTDTGPASPSRSIVLTRDRALFPSGLGLYGSRSSLTGTSLQNVEHLRDLLAASHDANIAFLHHISSMRDLNKLDLFLRFQDGADAGR
jgi:hypothetical protein